MHYTLATVLQAEGKLKEARDEYRKYLREEDHPKFAEKARDAIALINNSISSAP
jgi:hypothetical protein